MELTGLNSEKTNVNLPEKKNYYWLSDYIKKIIKTIIKLLGTA